MSRPRVIGLLLALGTLLIYLPVCHYHFVDYDDDDYVADNPVVQNGLTWAGLKWAFTTWQANNWHPVTWLSHMLDCELFGLNPGAQHAVNVLFHAANAVLLLALLLRLTQALWPSAFVAALFAWHPLHVESVAWIAERKDVLSTFFGLLTLLAYVRFAQSKAGNQGPATSVVASGLNARSLAPGYTGALIFFVLGLMCKPMLVTLPFVMMLLDYWPLGRVTNYKGQVAGILRLMLEKWPFFVLSAASCVMTFLAQAEPGNEAVISLDKVPLFYRLGNALAAYGRYLLKMVWPTDLAVFYPMSDKIIRVWTTAIVAAIVLTAISWCVWRGRRSRPYLLVGWLWFLGTLVPVIGLVQVGGAALADRYTYIPSIGVFLAVAFGARDLAGRFQPLRIPVGIAAGLILASCLMLTENQLRFWRDSQTLFTHALAVTRDNDVARINLGVALEQQGQYNEALAEYRKAEQLTPKRFQVHNDLGNLLADMDKPAEALAEYQEAVRLKPELPLLHDDLGSMLAKLGRFNKAMGEFTNAMRLDPDYPWPHFEMAKALLQQGRDAEALGQLSEALRLGPDNFQILAYTAHVLAADENSRIRDGRTALTLAARANALTGGTQPFVLDALGMAYAETGDFTNAVAVVQKAIDLAKDVKMKKLGPLRQQLELYKGHQPWRESFRFTNTLEEP